MMPVVGMFGIAPRVKSELRVLRNALFARFGHADHGRWNSPEGLEQWWDERTKLLADWIPSGTRVIEFGAGRRRLEAFLPQDCVYIPSDLTDRGPGTIVCDLNQRPLPDLRSVAPSVAVFSGVLEYVKDIPTLVEWLVESGVRTFVLSFDPVPAGLSWYGMVRERRRRLFFGYMNLVTQSQLCSIFERAGLTRTREEVWTTQRLYSFERSPR